ncbi:MAG: FAD binding domain-containing protein [Sandaracinaceae bacterium]
MYRRAKTIEDVTGSQGELRAGGTDLQERLRSGVSRLPIVDVQAIEGLNHVEVREDGVDIGALVTLREVGEHPGLRAAYPALTLPAQLLATPQARSRGTMGGVLCQRTRCWYFRNPHLGCPKKGNAEVCPSRDGNHDFGVVFDFGPCVYPHPSSIGAALLTYDATLSVTGRGRITVADLYGDGSALADHQLGPGEMITQVHLPAPVAGEQGAYQRLMSRALAEWPLVEVAVRLVVTEGSIALARVAVGGVANIPFRLTEVEGALEGQPATDEVFEAAAARSTERARPLPSTGYKVAMVEALVAATLLDARDRGQGALDFAM